MTRPRPTLLAAIAVGVVVGVFAVLLATRDGGTRASESAPIVGELAPAVDGEVIRGEPLDIAATDRWIVVNFFATWCIPCVQEHPELVAFAEEHDELGDAEVISVTYDQKAETVRDWFDEHGGDWTVVDSDEGRTAFEWGVTGVPESYVVAPNGIVVQRVRGGVTKEGLDAILAAASGRDADTADTDADTSEPDEGAPATTTAPEGAPTNGAGS